MPERSAASMIGAALSTNGPAQFITALAPAIARSSDAGSSTDARRTSDSGCASATASSFAASRPEKIGVHPRLYSSETTKRPVCPYAPNTVTVRFEIIKDFLAADSIDRDDGPLSAAAVLPG